MSAVDGFPASAREIYFFLKKKAAFPTLIVKYAYEAAGIPLTWKSETAVGDDSKWARDT